MLFPEPHPHSDFKYFTGFAVGIFVSLYVDQDFISVFFHDDGIDMLKGFLIMLVWVPLFMIIPSILCVKRVEKNMIAWGILGFFMSYAVYFIFLTEWVMQQIRISSPYFSSARLPLKMVMLKTGKILVYIFVAGIVLCAICLFLWFVFSAIDSTALTTRKK